MWKITSRSRHFIYDGKITENSRRNHGEITEKSWRNHGHNIKFGRKSRSRHDIKFMVEEKPCIPHMLWQCISIAIKDINSNLSAQLLHQPCFTDLLNFLVKKYCLCNYVSPTRNTREEMMKHILHILLLNLGLMVLCIKCRTRLGSSVSYFIKTSSFVKPS